jgi:Xaa-Pro dipeptidase
MTNSRFDRLVQAMKKEGLDALAINPGPSLSYLTGLPFHLMERPTVLLIVPDKTPVLILPDLEKLKLPSSRIPVEGFTYHDNPASWPAVFEKAAATLGLAGKTIGVEPNRMRFLELRYLEDAIPAAHFVSSENIFSALRMQKDPVELKAMRQAVQIAQQALLATIPFIHPGVTERAISSELVSQLLKAGTDPDMPFFPIVSGGPNSANPHAVPSDRPVGAGELLVIDWGAACEGYASDLTRTFAIGDVEPEYERIAEVVLQANMAGRAAGKPGIAAGQVDAAARQVIDAAGYGVYFTHRVGHGLGMEGHEPPYMFAENKLVLQPGMTYTVEPGIYLPNRGGVRIEDNVVITDDGCETLSDLPRQLKRLS